MSDKDKNGTTDEFWEAVRVAARILRRVSRWHEGGVLESSSVVYDEVAMRRALLVAGFGETLAQQVAEWLEQKWANGSWVEAVSWVDMTETEGTRVAHPLDRVFISDELWSKLQVCRERGQLSPGQMESVIEWIRLADTRDWDDQDVIRYITQLMAVTGRDDAAVSMARALGKAPRRQFDC